MVVWTGSAVLVTTVCPPLAVRVIALVMTVETVDVVKEVRPLWAIGEATALGKLLITVTSTVMAGTVTGTAAGTVAVAVIVWVSMIGEAPVVTVTGTVSVAVTVWVKETVLVVATAFDATNFCAESAPATMLSPVILL